MTDETDKPPREPTHFAAMVRAAQRVEKPVLTVKPGQRVGQLVGSVRVSNLPNMHRLVSEGLSIVEIELERLRQTAALGGLSPSETRQFEIYLKALPILSDADDRCNGTIAGKQLSGLSNPELAEFAANAIKELGDGNDR